MVLMKFSRLSLLSQAERRGLQIDFSSPQTILVAGNGFGKSAILKSLYDTLGAKPHKIDRSWRDAKVASLLEFTLDGISYAALKTGTNYSILDNDKKILISTSHVTSQLGPFLAELLRFRLVLADKTDRVKTPPPSYMFAPFCIDQDESWQKTWSAFSDLKMFSNGAKALAEYHSGLRPNEFYEAKAERDRLKVDLNKTDAERNAVDQALRKIQEAMPATPIVTNLDAFQEETDRLIRDAQALHNEEARYRKELAVLNEEFHVWMEHVTIVQTALAELDESFKTSLDMEPNVECPMCGQHYSNHIVDQFEIIADKDELLQSLQLGRQKTGEIETRIATHRRAINGVVIAHALFRSPRSLFA